MRFLALFIMCFVSFNSLAADIYNCPERILIKSEVIDPPTGWEVPLIDKHGSPHYSLESMTFTYGAPEDKGYLRPSNVTEDGNGASLTEYNLSYYTEKRVWLVCKYSGTLSIIAKKLSKPYSSCAIETTKDFTIQKALCQ